jgi:patatin-like phospholipase/acyl hydrolase
MRILSIDGGGYLGLATATFIEEIERHFGTSCHERFDLFCGTSTGAIIALALASGMKGAEVTKLYREFGEGVFRNPFPGSRPLRFVRGLLVSRYSNRRLKTALTKAFGDLTLGDIKARNKQVLVTSFCVTSGPPRIFKTDHSFDLTGHDRYLVRDVALASSAAPVYLPLITISTPGTGVDERYCDGGLFANHPALLGYAEAVSHLGRDSAQIQILSLSTPRSNQAERASAGNPISRFLLSRGVLPWAPKLINVMIDSTSNIADETLRRLMNWDAEMAGKSPLRYVRIRLEKPPGTDLDVATPWATEALQQVGLEKGRQTQIRNQVALFFRN